MRITSIEPQKKNPARRNLFADGEFILGVSIDTLLRFGIRVGDDLSPDVLRELKRAEELFSAKAAALRLLSVRPRAVREIRDRLREKEFGDEEIGLAIDDLTRAGLLNDDEFARMYIRDSLLGKGTGTILLRRKLLLLGVDKETIARALQETLEGVDIPAQALQAAREFVKKTRNLRKDEQPVKVRNRTASFLARRGFSWDIIAPVLKQLFNDPDQAEP